MTLPVDPITEEDVSCAFELLFNNDPGRLAERPEHLRVPLPKSNSGRFLCPKCATSFTRKDNLRNHLKFQCGQLPRFNCPYCEYRTKHSPNVRTHVRRLHPDREIYVVDVLLGKNLF